MDASGSHSGRLCLNTPAISETAALVLEVGGSPDGLQKRRALL